MTFANGSTYDFQIDIICPQLEVVPDAYGAPSMPILTTTTYVTHRRDTISFAGGPLGYITGSAASIELSTDQLYGDGIAHKTTVPLIKVNGSSELLRRSSDGRICSALSSATTYKTWNTVFGWGQTHSIGWNGSSATVAGTAARQINSASGAIGSITSCTINAPGCITSIKVTNSKKDFLEYLSTTDNVVVFGATSGGITAAADAIRNGATARVYMRFREVIPGGMSTGGLSKIDASSISNFGGWALDMLNYANEIKGNAPNATTDTEPKYMLKFFDYLIRAYRINMHPTRPSNNTPGGIVSATKNNSTKRVTSFTTASNQLASGDYFIDASYEGDLMAAAGVSYVTGREAADTSTDANGVQRAPFNGNRATQPGTTDSAGVSYYQFYGGNKGPDYTAILTVDPFVKASDSSSGTLSGIQADPGLSAGSADNECQAYNFRQTLVRNSLNPSLFVAFPNTAPAGYTPQQYELLGRYLLAQANAGFSCVAYPSESASTYSLYSLAIFNGVGNAFDINSRNGFSSDWFGANWGADFQAIAGSTASQYCEASNSERSTWWNALKNYTLGWWYYLQYDSANEVAALSATIAAGGSGYAAGDIIYCNVANTMFPVAARVKTVSAGAVTAVEFIGGVMTRGQSAPGNPVAQSTTSGSGTGCTLNITWGSRVPSQLRTDALDFGLSNDNHQIYCEEDIAGFMPEMYLREGRRLDGVAKLYASDVLAPIGSTPVISTNSIAAGSYAVDSHHTRRYAIQRSGVWRTECEGNIVIQRTGLNSWFCIPLEVVLPKATDCTNMFVTFCASATHMGFGALRMEPAHMAISQSCGLLAAQMALGSKPDVQNFNYSTFRTAALAEGQIMPQVN